MLLCLYRFTAVFLIVISTTFDSYSHDSAIDLTERTIDELRNIEVTTVSKKPERFMDVAAAVYVITAEDIRRSGVRTIPDALRMVPGVEVAQIDANKSAVAIRGFNERFSNKLLVLIDGRSIYTPLFAGVLWEEIDVLLQDIERIEVWRGPGGTLWGANAVNGVINIITKSSRDTKGLLVETGAGNEERGFVDFRYGGVTGEDFNYRIYGKFFNRDNSGGRDGREAHDSWSSIRGGFRTDWGFSEKDSLTVQGDIYRVDFDETLEFSTLDPPFSEVVDVDGHYVGLNLLSRWQHEYSANSNAAVQVYYDFTRRFIYLGKERRHTIDLDIQHIPFSKAA